MKDEEGSILLILRLAGKIESLLFVLTFFVTYSINGGGIFSSSP